MCRTCLRYRARCAEPSISGFRRCGKRNAYTTISACGRARCRAQQGSPAPLGGGCVGRGGAAWGVSAPPTPPAREHSGDPTLRCPRRRRTTRRVPTALRAPTRLARLRTGAAPGHACAEGRRRGSPTCTAPMAITHMQNKKMPRGTSGKVTIKENCSQKTQSAACRPSHLRPAAERAGGGGWARGLLPPEQLRGMFELRLGSRKPRPQFSWTLAVSGGQGYGGHTLR